MTDQCVDASTHHRDDGALAVEIAEGIADLVRRLTRDVPRGRAQVIACMATANAHVYEVRRMLHEELPAVVNALVDAEQLLRAVRRAPWEGCCVAALERPLR